MKKKLVTITTLLILIVVLSGSGFAEEPEAWNNPANMSGTIWFTTDYVFRGLSNTNENPAIQGSLDYTFKGFYVGIWGSNTNITAEAIEIDFYGGYAGSLGNLGYDIMGIYYSYPDGSDDPEINAFEAHLGLTYTFAGVPLEPTLGVGYNYSPDFYGEDGTGNYVNGTLDLALPYGLGLGGEIGYQDVKGDKTTGKGSGMNGGDGFDYVHWRVSVNKDIKDWFTLDLGYHDTDSDAKAFFGVIAESRVVFTVSRTF